MKVNVAVGKEKEEKKMEKEEGELKRDEEDSVILYFDERPMLTRGNERRSDNRSVSRNCSVHISS